jgi:hypothetical protein
MSTACRIARKNSSGLYDSIYCHNDGYPRYMLNMLRTCYGSDLRVAELIDYGDASSIKERLMPTDFTHCFERPQEGVCVFYHRDRGEPWDDVGAIYDDSKEALIRSSVDYVYIFEDSRWTCYSNGQECF